MSVTFVSIGSVLLVSHDLVGGRLGDRVLGIGQLMMDVMMAFPADVARWMERELVVSHLAEPT